MIDNATEIPCAELDLSAEEQQLVANRFARFTMIGFDAAQAMTLALSYADYHLAEALAAAGCPLGTLERIIAD